LRSYISEYALIVKQKEEFKHQGPWLDICHSLGTLHSIQLEDVLLQSWKCADDLFDRNLGPFSQYNPSNYGGYIMSRYTDSNLSGRVVAHQNLLLGYNNYADVLGHRHHFMTCNVLYNLQKDLIQLGQYIEAEVIANDLLARAEDARLTGKEPMDGMALQAMSLVHYHLKNNDLAEFYLRQDIADSIKDAQIDDDVEVINDIITDWSKLESWLREWGRDADADATRAEMNAWLGPDDIDIEANASGIGSWM
jgi:hypothetical protein